MGAKSGGSQTTTVKPDPRTQQYLDYYRQAAMNLGGSYMGQFAPQQGGAPQPGGAPAPTPAAPYPTQTGMTPFGGAPAVSRGEAPGGMSVGQTMQWMNGNPVSRGPTGPQAGIPGGPPAPLGVDPASQAAGQGYGGLAGIGGQAAGGITRGQAGLDRMAGGDVSNFFNPYQQQVVDAMHGDFDRQRAAGMTAANQQATAANAFGGSRQAVLQAQNLDNVNRNEASTLANLRNTGYQNAFTNGLNVNQGLINSGLAGGQLGLGANSGLFGYGDYARGIGMEQQNAPWDRAAQGLGILAGGVGGGGQTTSQPYYHNPLGGAIGGASAGFGIGGPVGAGIGGFLGLFS